MNYILPLIIACIWGVFPFLIQYGLEMTSLNILLLLMSFSFFASAVCYNLWFYKGNLLNEIKQVKNNVFICLILGAFIALFLKNLIYLHVIKTTNNLNIAIAITSLSSVISLAYAYTVIKLDVSLGSIIGIILTAIGVFTTLYFKNS